MKILIINNLGTLHGGAEAMIFQLRSNLENDGHTVRVLSGSEKGSGEKIADASFLTFSPNSFFFRVMYVFNPFALLSLKRELRDFRPDVVHLHTISKASPFILAPLKKYPTVLTLHDHSLFDPTRIEDLSTLQPYRENFSDYFINRPSLRFYLEKFRFFMLRLMADNVDTVFACSDFYAQCAKESGIFKNIKTLHNGIILPPFSSITNRKNILFVGRLSEEKGIPILLKAIALIKDSHPDMKLLVAGDGRQRRALKRTAIKLKIEDITFFLGYKNAANIIELYRQSSVVAVPSFYPENLPTVCIEAMAIGRPIVASKIGGLPELVKDGETGYLVAPGDADKLAESIDRLLSDFELMQKMGEAGRGKAEKDFEGKTYAYETFLEYERLNKEYKKL